MDAETLRDRLRMMDEFESMGKDALKGFISDLRQGVSGAEASANALERVGERLPDLALDSLLSNGKNGTSLQSGITSLSRVRADCNE